MEPGRQFGPLFHGTTEEHADRILAEGVRTQDRPGSMQMAGPGFYTTANKEHALTYAKSRAEDGPKGSRGVVIEGHVENPKEYRMGRQEDSDLSEKDYTNGRSADWHRNIGLRSEGYNVLTKSHGDQDMHIVLRPKTFVPRRLHYPNGETVDLG